MLGSTRGGYFSTVAATVAFENSTGGPIENDVRVVGWIANQHIYYIYYVIRQQINAVVRNDTSNRSADPRGRVVDLCASDPFFWDACPGLSVGVFSARLRRPGRNSWGRRRRLMIAASSSGFYWKLWTRSRRYRSAAEPCDEARAKRHARWCSPKVQRYHMFVIIIVAPLELERLFCKRRPLGQTTFVECGPLSPRPFYNSLLDVLVSCSHDWNILDSRSPLYCKNGSLIFTWISYPLKLYVIIITRIDH